jgi:hypothetical protein
VARTAPAGNNGTPASEKSFLYDKHFSRHDGANSSPSAWRM